MRDVALRVGTWTSMYKPAWKGFVYDLSPQIVVMSRSMTSNVSQAGQQAEM